MTAEIIKLEDVIKERAKRKHEVLCFGYICELIEDISQTTNIEDIHEIFSKNLNAIKLGQRPFTAFIEAVSESDHLEMMLNHLQCLLAEIDMAEPFRVARKLYPEDIPIIDLMERDFEAFSLEVNRSDLDERDEINHSFENLNRKGTPTNIVIPDKPPCVGVHFSEKEDTESSPNFN
jgi:hypothetical protein